MIKILSLNNKMIRTNHMSNNLQLLKTLNNLETKKKPYKISKSNDSFRKYFPLSKNIRQNNLNFKIFEPKILMIYPSINKKKSNPKFNNLNKRYHNLIIIKIKSPLIINKIKLTRILRFLSHKLTSLIFRKIKSYKN